MVIKNSRLGTHGCAVKMDLLQPEMKMDSSPQQLRRDEHVAGLLGVLGNGTPFSIQKLLGASGRNANENHSDTTTGVGVGVKRFKELDVDLRVHSVELKGVVDKRTSDGWFLLGNSVESSEWTLLWGKQ